MNLAIVVPRYGAGVAGGAEILARRVAGMLAESHRVTVLTSTASNYETWANDLPAGESEDDGVRVLRFAVQQPRGAYWTALDRLLLRTHQSAPSAFADEVEPWRQAGAEHAPLRRSARGGLSRWPLGLQREYLRRQGPETPDLFAWLDAHGAEQQHVIFFTYLYPTTYFGMRHVRPEAIDLYPTLHDEPVAYLPVFGECFRGAARALFSTHTEAGWAQRLFGAVPRARHVLGCGVAEPGQGSEPAIGPDPFVLYVGRIDVNKGVPSMARDFIAWKKSRPASRLRLVLAGEQYAELPQHPSVRYLGRVSEDDKIGLMRRARALVHPSLFESLGLVLLEAFWCGTPALVSAGNDVLVGHCHTADGGLWYRDRAELGAALEWLEAHPDAAAELGLQGREYVRREYSLAAYRARLAALYPAD